MLASRSPLLLALIALAACSPQPQAAPEPVAPPATTPQPPQVTEPDWPRPEVPVVRPAPQEPRPRPRPVQPAAEPVPAQPEAPEPRPRVFHMPDAWVGRWDGPEGLFLEVTPGEATNTVRLRLKDTLDAENDYIGVLLPDGIRFERAGRTEIIRRGSGEETGFSALRSRTDCVIIRTGEEGYCRPAGRPRAR